MARFWPISGVDRDRPYKDAMSLSPALDILDKFRQNGHIDPDLQDVFVNSEIFCMHAAVFLAPNQEGC